MLGQSDVRYILATLLSALKLPVGKRALLNENLGAGGALVASAICPMHGPLVRSTLTELVREYRTVSMMTHRCHDTRFPESYHERAQPSSDVRTCFLLQWTAEQLKQTEETFVAVIYASAYGNTSALAQAIRFYACSCTLPAYIIMHV